MYLNPRIVGCGERTLVLSHGYGGSQAIWDKVLPHLSKSNKVLLFDWDFARAAAGEDEDEERYTFSRFADELVALMDEVKLKGAVFVGHSMAGMVGCIASIRRPDLFTHLVLVGASPRFVHTSHPSPCISTRVALPACQVNFLYRMEHKQEKSSGFISM
uniref:Uncharacterized protein n=2 Tax=Avena sativa TaxID=4498 RepID=A0ACD6ATM7_AVESA